MGEKQFHEILEEKLIQSAEKMDDPFYSALIGNLIFQVGLARIVMECLSEIDLNQTE